MPRLDGALAGHLAWRALWNLITNPLLYIGLALQLWEHRRSGTLQRRLFGVRATVSLRPLLHRWLSGLVCGMAASAVLLAAGAVVFTWEVWAVVAVSVLLGLIRPRWFASTVAIPVLVLLAGLARLWEPVSNAVWTRPWHQLAALHAPTWLAVVGVLNLAEALLLILHRRQPAYPVVVRGRRGRPIGALAVQLSWMVPVAVWTPNVGVHPASAPALAHLGWPWPSAAAQSLMWLAVPLWAGFSAAVLTSPAEEGLASAVRSALAAGVLSLMAAVGSRWLHPACAAVGAILVLVAREWGVWAQFFGETRREPLFAPSPDGVRVLATVEGSLAEKMGLRPGEVITQVNQVPVHTAYDLHFALDQNPAYARLHVLDLRGELRMAGKPVYVGERHQLGLIPVPDMDCPALRMQPGGLFATLSWVLSDEDGEARVPPPAYTEAAAARDKNGEASGSPDSDGGPRPPSV